MRLTPLKNDLASPSLTRHLAEQAAALAEVRPMSMTNDEILAFLLAERDKHRRVAEMLDAAATAFHAFMVVVPRTGAALAPQEREGER